MLTLNEEVLNDEVMHDYIASTRCLLRATLFSPIYSPLLQSTRTNGQKLGYVEQKGTRYLLDLLFPTQNKEKKRSNSARYTCMYVVT